MKYYKDKLMVYLRCHILKCHDFEKNHCRFELVFIGLNYVVIFHNQLQSLLFVMRLLTRIPIPKFKTWNQPIHFVLGVVIKVL